MQYLGLELAFRSTFGLIHSNQLLVCSQVVAAIVVYCVVVVCFDVNSTPNNVIKFTVRSFPST